jgi:threonine aldolase
MHFGSDNVVGASAQVMQALIEANAAGPMASYGEDAIQARVKAELERVFEREIALFLLASGTAANGLALAALTPGWGEVFCHTDAHVMTDECGGPEFFTGGAKITPLAGLGGKLTPATLEAALSMPRRGIHSVKPTTLSLTNLTECGTRYSAKETAALTEVAKRYGLKVHLDGARFSNALVAGKESPADLTWRAGVDILCLGATKNGAMAAEAVIVFDPALAETLPYRRMRAGHLLSKGRFLSAQFEGWLKDNHWLELARTANARAKRLAKGLSAAPRMRLAWKPDGNEVFAIMPIVLEEKLHKEGFRFYRWRQDALPPAERPKKGEVLCRLVCSFATRNEDIDALVDSALR